MIALSRIRNDSCYAFLIRKIQDCNSYFRDCQWQFQCMPRQYFMWSAHFPFSCHVVQILVLLLRVRRGRGPYKSAAHLSLCELAGASDSVRGTRTRHVRCHMPTLHQATVSSTSRQLPVAWGHAAHASCTMHMRHAPHFKPTLHPHAVSISLHAHVTRIKLHAHAASTSLQAPHLTLKKIQAFDNDPSWPPCLYIGHSGLSPEQTITARFPNQVPICKSLAWLSSCNLPHNLLSFREHTNVT